MMDDLSVFAALPGSSTLESSAKLQATCTFVSCGKAGALLLPGAIMAGLGDDVPVGLLYKALSWTFVLRRDCGTALLRYS